MGSRQSTPSGGPNPNEASPSSSLPQPPPATDDGDDAVTASWSATLQNVRQAHPPGTGGTKPRKDPKHLTGAALVEYRCRKKKRAWSRCVSDHYEHKFLPGKALEPQEDCDDLFDAFRTCYLKGMLRERQKRGAPPPKEGTMLFEFMEDEGMFAEIAANQKKG